MVGHTGNLEVVIKACEAVDKGFGELLAAVDKNADQMWEAETNSPHTRHTLNPVEVVIYGKDKNGASLQSKNFENNITFWPTCLHWRRKFVDKRNEFPTTLRYTVECHEAERGIDPSLGGAPTVVFFNRPLLHMIDLPCLCMVFVNKEFNEIKMAPPNTGRLADIAPTVLALMGLPQPPEMTGKSLIVG
jgi:bisphosphoglycerate-independent phosphoglycerate mutase (AlkP superfamily)